MVFINLLQEVIDVLERFYPDVYIDNIFLLPLDEFKKRGIKALVFDIDNTVAPYDMAEADEEIISLFKFLKEEGYRLCLLSNNNKKRVEKFNEKLEAMAVYRAGKPGVKKLENAMFDMGVTKKQTALVGDQVFTDIYCAHKAGVMAVLTKPMCNRDQLVTKVKRGLERRVLQAYQRRMAK